MLVGLLGVTLWSAATTAEAQGRSNPYSWEDDFAVVVLVSAKEIVFDQGTNAGVRAGDKVVLYRTITIHHPITGAEITDRFPIGEVRVAESSELLSIIKNSKRLKHPPKVGDLVRLAPPRPAAPAPSKADEAVVAAAPVPCAPAAGVMSPEQKALQLTYAKSLGRPIDRRIRLYEEFVSRFPAGAYTDKVRSEITWLKALRRHLTELRARPVADRTEEQIPASRVLHSALTRLEVGDQAQVVVAVVAHEPAAGARLFLRREGEEGFDDLPLEPTGAYYFRARIPARYVEERGSFEYFVEVAFDDGPPVPVVASGADPKVVKVGTAEVDEIERRGRSTARALFEYVNFDMDKKVDDEYWAFEADYFYRISTFLYGVRVGMGIFAGTGGKLKEIEESKVNNRELAANYGFVEGEFEVVPMFHFMLRLAAGNQRATDNEDARMTGVFGFEGGVRIGEERKTNLVASGAVLQHIGYEARLALAINVFERVPINLEGLVTNYPVDDSHLGLRIVLGTGFRFTDWLAILARGSWNARTIRHTGFGGGASLALSW
jgi:hypothetical protein